MDYSADIAGRTIEFFDAEHLYLVDGVMVPSITEIVSWKFHRKYAGIPAATLSKAAAAGTAVHEAIDRWCKDGVDTDLPELRGFKWLQKQYGFDVVDGEKPVILFRNGEPVAAGRYDMTLRMDGKLGGADIKRTSVLDKDYLAYQLNLYRIAYRQSYGAEWEFLRALHLREDKRKFVEIPVAEDMAWELIDKYLEKGTSK